MNQLAKFGLDATAAPGAKAPRWRPVYWLYAAAIPAIFYALEALKVSLYHTARAPNVSLLAQLVIMLACYGVWILVPRICWLILSVRKERGGVGREPALFRLAVLGVMFSSVHMLMFTLMRLMLFASEAWQWEPVHILHKYGEIWFGFGGVWLIVYALLAAVMLGVMSAQAPAPAPLSRYEIRDNGKTFSLALNDIYWISAAGNYVELHTVRGAIIARKTLARIEEELGGHGFLASHRGALINGRHVVAIKSAGGGSGFAVQLSNDAEAPLSRRRLSTFKSLLKSVD